MSETDCLLICHARILLPTFLDPIFAHGDRLIAVHAEDQARINQRRTEFAGISDPAIQSTI
jgi:dihydroorotase